MLSRLRLPLAMTGVLLLVLAGGVVPAFVAAAGQPAPFEPTRTAAPSAPATKPASPAASMVPSGTTPYSMDFTLPTLGKAGCMVCHGDRNLIRIKGDQYVSYYIDDSVMRSSAHAQVVCTGCHLDFAYKAPHKNNGDWRKTGKLACKNCHQDQYTSYTLGSHSIENKPGQSDPKADLKPLCGDCHGAHDITRLTNTDKTPNTDALATLHLQGYRICGRCHQKEWDSYSDYYHGAAYRRGALDAPACWDCHDAHTILPSSDRRSPTNEARLVETCGGGLAGRTCHADVNEQFVSYTWLIHRRAAALGENPLYSWMVRTQEGISAALSNIVGAVRSWFT